MNKLFMAMLALGVALSFGSPMAVAQHGNGHGNGNGNGNGNGHGDANAEAEGHGNGNAHGNKHGDDDDHGWRKEQSYEYRTYAGEGQYPPGWSHGKKTGWGNCGLPPGQAKKYGCRTYTYQGRPYYYYQNEVGQIIVRRPIISVQGGVTIAP
jgi:hypothetical protein